MLLFTFVKIKIDQPVRGLDSVLYINKCEIFFGF